MVTVRDEREEAEIMKYVGVHDVNMGKGRVRKSFATIDEVVEMPDLIEVQKNSYERFLRRISARSSTMFLRFMTLTAI